MLTPFKSSSLVLLMISSMSVHICNYCFYASRANSGKITTFKECTSLILICAGLLKLGATRLELLKSEFNAKDFIPRLSWSISSYFVAIHS